MIDGFRRLATSGNAIRIEGERELKRGTLYGLFTLTHNGIIHQCGITSYHVVRPTPNGPGGAVEQEDPFGRAIMERWSCQKGGGVLLTLRYRYDSTPC